MADGTVDVKINLDSTSAEAEAKTVGDKIGSSVKGGLSSVGSALGTAVKVGAVAGATALAGLTTAAVNAYADFQQLTGGVETLFGTSASTVEEYANNAYVTAGLSANEYMSTVTSFSASLINSLGGDTAAAADLANQAVTDMADNANKMGTDISSIQMAYQGFAKQNYTMLDNLKLGYGGTKSEMERLLSDAEAISGVHYDISSYADVVSAINVIQTEMGITGTTAEEAAHTVSGSINMMKSSWENWLTALGNPDADMTAATDQLVASVGTVMENVMPVIVQVLTSIMEYLPAALSQVGMVLQEQWPVISAALMTLVTQFGSWLTENFPLIITAFATIFTQICEWIVANGPMILDSILQMLVSLVAMLIENGPAILTAVGSVLNMLVDWVLAKLGELLLSIGQWALSIVGQAASAASGFFNTIQSWLAGLPGAFVGWLSSMISGAGQWVADMGSKAAQGAQDFYDSLISFFGDAGSWLLDVGQDLLEGLWNGIEDATGWIVDQLSGLGDTIVGGIASALGIASPSKRMRYEIGRFIPQGIAQGIKDTETSATGAVKNLSDDMVKAFDASDPLGSISDAMSSGLSSVSTSMTIGAQAELLSASGSNASSLGSIASGMVSGLKGVAESNRYIILDTGALVGSTTDRYDDSLGFAQQIQSRGFARCHA